jgi:peptidoglycan hydrolase CwlO-like protein
MPIKKLIALCCVVLVAVFPLLATRPVFSENLDVSSGHLDKITKELTDLKDALGKSIAATKPLQSELNSMQQQIKGIKTQVTSVEYDMQNKKQAIDDSYKNLAHKQQIVLHTIRDFYIKSYTESPLTLFLSQVQAGEKTQEEMYQDAKTKQDKDIITNIALSITDLENKKQQLEQEQKWLIATKANLDEQSAKLDGIIKGALAYQQDVSTKIQSLSEQQQAIINARSGSFTATVGDSDLADDYNASIKGFHESAPAGSFAVFSFGAFTHRKGMSQYGAFGRANSGQDYHAILKAYYGKDVSSTDTGGTIQVAGAGTIDFETQYLYGIAEMPSSFPTEALKAQAVAARTYAYRYKQNSQEICADEGCQVYSGSKAANPPDAWKAAVDATKGQIIDGVVTYFSSTTGGYLTTMGWDTTDGNGGSNFTDKAYEKIAGSPWLYKAWYTQGYSTSSDKCGRDSPWLNPEEMADIVNAAIALRTGGIDTSRITPVSSCWGGNPYSMSELRSIAPGSISSATSVSVSQGNGTTNNVTVNGINFSGDDFKRAFNLRAPGRLSIPQSGFAFFNIEQK